MGKRSDFTRLDKDFYRTIDPRAVEALLPFLNPETRFWEICAGQGDLLNELEKYSHTCTYACDNNLELFEANDMPSRIMFANAFSICYDRSDLVDKYDCIISNPPWTRDILHQLIEYITDKSKKPVWFLFDADWAHTKQSAMLIHRYCTDIVSIGRLKWIPNTTMSGKDNCCWYCFNANKTQGDPPLFHGRKYE